MSGYWSGRLAQNVLRIHFVSERPREVSISPLGAASLLPPVQANSAWPALKLPRELGNELAAAILVLHSSLHCQGFIRLP